MIDAKVSVDAETEQSGGVLSLPEVEGNVQTEDRTWHYVCGVKWAHEARDVLGWWPDIPATDDAGADGS